MRNHFSHVLLLWPIFFHITFIVLGFVCWGLLAEFCRLQLVCCG